MILLVALLANSMLLPVSLSFFHEVNLGWLIYAIITDIVFLMDVVTIFWTGIITENNYIVLDIKAIRWNYIKSWLIVDIICLLPYDYISFLLYSLSDDSDVVRLLRPVSKLLVLIKFLRFIKFIYLFSKWKEV